MRTAAIVLIFGISLAISAAIYTSVQAPASVQAPGLECTRDEDCAVGGCSGQVCTTAAAAPGIITTCEWRAEYDCLRLTSCSCISGTCGWRNTTEYQSCLARLAG